MTLILLPNNVWPLAAQIKVTDTSNVATSDTAGVDSVAGGDRRLAWTGSTDARRLVYVNKAGGLTATHVVVARADAHEGKDVSVLKWSAYPGSSSSLFSSASFAETLLGPRQQDWVLAVSASNVQGIGLSLNSSGYEKHVYKFYASNAIALNYPGPPTYQLLRFPSRHNYRRQTWLVDARWSFVADAMTRAEVDAFETIPGLLSDPLFVYDADGYLIPNKLIHGVVTDFRVDSLFDDLFRLSFNVAELRQWP